MEWVKDTMLKIKTFVFENKMTKEEALKRYLDHPGHRVYLLENGKALLQSILKIMI
ncbi:MAG TPA: hypothetical protein IAA12_03985 [Candidatus Blautia intestinipullorum]|nr:hypothetical protein [Candidatus Blautia intestinipullorum]